MRLLSDDYRMAKSGFGVWMVLLVLLLAASSCSKAPQKAGIPASQESFGSPEDAGAALVAAAKSGDRKALLAIFGPDSGQALLSGDAAKDQAALKEFVDAYWQMHRWSPIQAGGQVLQVGADNHPFPIPLGQNSSGRWYFDTAAGKDEILARRIGRNELIAMDVSAAIAGAQRRYREESHDGGQGKYALQFLSDPGKHNGLYWPAGGGQGPSPLDGMGAFTEAVNTTPAGKAPLFNGYYYRIVAPGDTFAILAYPAEYRNSGIMSFLVGEDGAVYQKDLGEKTGDVAAGMNRIDSHEGWTPASGEAASASRMQ